MFTGIVETTGKLKKIENKKGKTYFTISVKDFLAGVKIGDSISCDGVCLTVVGKRKNNFMVELMPETLRLTKFRKSKEGQLINLEKSLKLGDRIDGHFVMGHVDGVGKIKEIIKEGKYLDLIIKAPKRVIKYLAYKGSVSINGVSLTIAGNGDNWIKVCLISHTLKVTNLSELKKGDQVNLEVDMIARYLEKLIKEK